MTQWLTLARRNLILKIRDRVQFVILLPQSPLFACSSSSVFQHDHQEPPASAPGAAVSPEVMQRFGELGANIGGIEFLMVVAAIWFGCNNAARDVVGELDDLPARADGELEVAVLCLLEVRVLAMLCVFQCTALLGLVYVFSDLSGSFLTLLAVLVSASLTGTALGLLISAVSPTTEAAIAFLPVVLLPFILLSGGIKPVHDAGDREADLGGHADALGLRSELPRGSA